MPLAFQKRSLSLFTDLPVSLSLHRFLSLWFSLVNWRINELRLRTNSPRRDEGKDTGFTRRRGRNRKMPSELPKLLSSISLSTGVGWTIWDHLWPLRVGANDKAPVRRRKMAGQRRWWSELTVREEVSRWSSGLSPNLIQPLNPTVQIYWWFDQWLTINLLLSNNKLLSSDKCCYCQTITNLLYNNKIIHYAVFIFIVRQ